MFPFLVILAILGADGLRTALAWTDRRCGASWSGCSLRAWWRRRCSSRWICTRPTPTARRAYFDTGEIAAIVTARDLAGSHRVYLSESLDPPYIEAFFHFLPPPPRQEETDDATPGLEALGMEVVPVEAVYASQPAVGDTLVLNAFGYDPLPPSGWTLVASERAPANAAGSLRAATGARDRLPVRRLKEASAAKVGAPVEQIPDKFRGEPNSGAPVE